MGARVGATVVVEVVDVVVEVDGVSEGAVVEVLVVRSRLQLCASAPMVSVETKRKSSWVFILLQTGDGWTRR